MAFRTNKTPVLQEKSASGSVATFSTALAMPLKSHKIALTATQSGSGTPSPSNVRAIHGFSEVNATRCGVNLWDEQWELGILSLTDGSNTPSNANLRCKNYITVKGNMSYYVVLPVSRLYVFWYDSNKTLISYTSPIANTTTLAPVNARYARFYCNSPYGTTYNNDISINYPSTDTEYHSYNGNTYTIQIGSTVYGGEYDARTGVLTVTHGYIASYNGEVINEPWISSMDKYVEGGTPTSGAQVVYPLSTPQTIQLPPCPIDTLEGVNNIWADTGDIDLTYNDLDIAKRGSFREVFKLPS